MKKSALDPPTVKNSALDPPKVKSSDLDPPMEKNSAWIRHGEKLGFGSASGEKLGPLKKGSNYDHGENPNQDPTLQKNGSRSNMIRANSQNNLVYFNFVQLTLEQSFYIV